MSDDSIVIFHQPSEFPSIDGVLRLSSRNIRGVALVALMVAALSVAGGGLSSGYAETGVGGEAGRSVSIFAGTGQSSKGKDRYLAGQPRGSATEIALGNPFGVEISADQIWITTVDDSCVWRCDFDGKGMTRVAGIGSLGYAGDGGPATDATFNWPHEVRVDGKGNLFVADTRNHVIRRIDGATGIVTTIAGNGKAGFAGEGKRGAEVQFQQPHSVVLDGDGGLLVADTQNHRLRRIDLATGTVTTVAGTGQRKNPTDGEPASGSPLFGPRSLAVDDRSIWVALREGNSVWRIDREKKTIHHVAGTGKKGYTGDGGPPLEATFNGPKGLVLDDHGRLLLVDTENHAVRRIDLTRGTVETVLGGKSSEATMSLKRPHGISFNPTLGFLVGDSEFHRVLRGR